MVKEAEPRDLFAQQRADVRAKLQGLIPPQGQAIESPPPSPQKTLLEELSAQAKANKKKENRWPGWRRIDGSRARPATPSEVSNFLRNQGK
jgi:hypothetical protein